MNALGDVYGPDGRPAAGLLNEKRTSLSCTLEEMFADIAPAENLFAGNTTLGVVVTNGKFDKTPLTKLAGMAHNGYARAIRPVHTTADGDSIYALSLGDVPGTSMWWGPWPPWPWSGPSCGRSSPPVPPMG